MIELTKCEKCLSFFKNHYWGSVKAHSAGWYIQKDGRAFCPNHRPSYAPLSKNQWGGCAKGGD